MTAGERAAQYGEETGSRNHSGAHAGSPSSELDSATTSRSSSTIWSAGASVVAIQVRRNPVSWTPERKPQPSPASSVVMVGATARSAGGRSAAASHCEIPG